MSGAALIAVGPPPEIPPPTREFDSCLEIPPLDTAYLSQSSDDVLSDKQSGDVVLEELDFDFSFDDMSMPSADVLDDLLNSPHPEQSDFLRLPEANFAQFGPNFGRLDGVIRSTAPELSHLSGDGGFSGDHSWDASGVLNSASATPGMESHQISGYLNVPSPESNGSNRDSTENCDPDAKDLNCPSPESQDSENFGSNVSESSNNCAGGSVSSSPDSVNCSIKTGVVDQKIKLEESANNNSHSSILKRKNEGEDLMKSNPEIRIVKYRKHSNSAEENVNNSSIDVDGLSEEEEKRKIRLMRNRESAQLSRQRKKHYIEELEDKVRTMHSTIQDLNMKISYVVAENATLRQQMGGNGGGAAAPAVPPPTMAPPPSAAPPPPGLYPHPAMMYPWMPCPPPYMMKPQGSQVPLVPIPRLKPQQPVQAPKENKKLKSRKNEGTKTKKVAGVSFLGLLFFIMLFGGLVPIFNMRYGGIRESFIIEETNGGNDFSGKHRGRVLMVNGTEYSEKHGGSRRDYSNSSVYCGQEGCGNKGEPTADEFVRLGNGSEHLAASLYVPRNDRLVKIDGNLIIHSVLASEKTKASHGKGGGETGLAFRGDLVPAIPTPDAGRNSARHPHLRALGSGSAEKDGMKSTATDGRLQQWFQEGLAGPMLSAGTCTEVFQFDVSAASGAIIPASAARNMSQKQTQNYTQLSKGKNRRILRSIPLPDSSHNISSERAASSENDNLNGIKNESSMVVSVLFDPREASDADVDGVMGTKSLSRIFVVVLIENVRYVTYSCMLPFKGIVSHLV